jgi:hypothetical protein
VMRPEQTLPLTAMVAMARVIPRNYSSIEGSWSSKVSVVERRIGASKGEPTIHDSMAEHRSATCDGAQ